MPAAISSLGSPIASIVWSRSTPHATSSIATAASVTTTTTTHGSRPSHRPSLRRSISHHHALSSLSLLHTRSEHLNVSPPHACLIPVKGFHGIRHVGKLNKSLPTCATIEVGDHKDSIVLDLKPRKELGDFSLACFKRDSSQFNHTVVKVAHIASITPSPAMVMMDVSRGALAIAAHGKLHVPGGALEHLNITLAHVAVVLLQSFRQIVLRLEFA